MIISKANRTRRKAPSRESFCIPWLLGMLIAAPAFLVIRRLEPGLVLPALSILLFSYAAIATIAAYLFHADRNSKDATLWDVAGAFALMACAAAIFSRPDQVALLFEQLFEQHSG
jgi:hypothetical protein